MEIQSPWVLHAVLSLILLVSLAGGIIRGLIKSVSWLPGLVLGVFAVKFFSIPLSSVIEENSTLSPLWSTYISVIALMGGCYLLVRLLASIFASFLDEIGLSAIDKILGGLFSLAFTLLVLGIILTIIDSTGALESVKNFLDSSWLVANIIRPFFSGTVSFVQEAM